jgi:hypothetical protein
MQASAREVVRELARYGVDVSEELVQRVKIELLRGVTRVRWQQAKVPRAVERPARHPYQKRPPRRSRRA